MIYKVSIRQFNNIQIEQHSFKSASSLEILKAFDSIDWEQQVNGSLQEKNKGKFLAFDIKEIATERKIGGLLMVYGQSEYNFHVKAELFQKRQKSHFFGLFKYYSLPLFENDAMPFEKFRDCLALFLKGNDLVIEKVLADEYPQYRNHGILKK